MASHHLRFFITLNTDNRTEVWEVLLGTQWHKNDVGSPGKSPNICFFQNTDPPFLVRVHVGQSLAILAGPSSETTCTDSSECVRPTHFDCQSQCLTLSAHPDDVHHSELHSLHCQGPGSASRFFGTWIHESEENKCQLISKTWLKMIG
jgi:hypothetical protein